MPSPTTAEEFLQLGQKSGLLNQPALDGYLRRKRAGAPLPDAPKLLAQLLVRDGLLTPFQAQQLLSGKWRGFVIAGKYKLLDCLGEGGMGKVFLCEHAIMRRRVAVKVLPASKVNDPSALERFHREARAVAALDHPNIVRAHDVDRDGALHFLVMEYIEGRGLDKIVAAEGPLDVGRAARYVAEAARGLQHAHQAGLIHRDVKPANLLVDRGDVLKILDMGLARFFHDDNDELTKEHDSQIVLGTADFLAPEQAVNSHEVDGRADVYSLGATFYYLLTAQRPFGDGSVAQKLLGHLSREPRPLRDVRPDVPEELAGVVAKMMAKDREARYQTAAAVVAALTPWANLATPVLREEIPSLTPANGAETFKVSSMPTPAPSRVPPPPTALRTPPPLLPPAAGQDKANSSKPSRAVTSAPRAARPRSVPAPKLERPNAIALAAKRRRRMLIGAGAAAAVLVGVAVQVFALRGGDGTLVAEISDPGAEAIVKGEGQEIVLSEARAGQPISLKPGAYQVQPAKGGQGVKMLPERFTLARGERVTIRVWREKPAERVPEPPVPVATTPLPVYRFGGHTERVEGVAFSPDGQRALSIGHDKLLRLWVLPGGQQVRVLKGHEGVGWCVAFLPDGRRAVSASSDRTIRLWNVDTGAELRRFRGHGEEVRCVAVSPDGRRLLSASMDKTLRLWDVESGNELRRLEGHQGGAWWVVFSSDGRQALSCAADKTVRLWDLDQAKPLRTLQGHTQEVRRVAFSPDGRQALSCGFDMTMRRWDLATGKELGRYDGRPYYVESVAYSADGRYALTSEGMVPGNDPALTNDRGIRLWDLETGQQVYRRGGVPDKVLHTVFSPDGRYALSACDDRFVRLWELPLLPGPTDRTKR